LKRSSKSVLLLIALTAICAFRLALFLFAL
jgi:hypothetical protein